jgi:TRAP-type C4-dicarboxylate transport system substrate-binding protein
MSQTKKIRWLIAHEPVNLFLRTAEAFKEKIAELTNNEYDVEIFTPSQYREMNQIRYNHAVPQLDPMLGMESGELEMSQLHITELAKWHSADFLALELPFLFRDHDHAAKVLEGEIGKAMLNGLTDRSPATGLAFTYSGGFRCVASDSEITSLSDLEGIKFATTHNPVTIDTVTAIGAVPESFTIQDFITKFREEGYSADALETTIPRYLAQFQNTSKKFLTNTKHSLFLTSIIISNKFLESLDADTRAKFEEACTYASRLERKWSVEDAENFAAKADHSDTGITYRELTADETAEFKAKTAPIVEKYKDFFSVGLVDGIIRS